MRPWVGVAAVLALLTTHWAAYEHGSSVEQAKAGQALAQRDRTDRLAEVIGERSARKEEQRRSRAQEEARAHAKEERTVADAAAAGADGAGQRLRSEAAQLAAAVGCPGPDTVSIARGQAATQAAMVLSHLLARSDERAGELAKAYDQALIAGKQCEAEYEGLRRRSG